MLLLAAAGLVAFVLLLYMVSPLISPKPLALPGAHVVVSGLLLLSLPGLLGRLGPPKPQSRKRTVERGGLPACSLRPGTTLPDPTSGTRLPGRRAIGQCHGEGTSRVSRALGLCAAR